MNGRTPGKSRESETAASPRVRLRFAWYDLWLGAYIDRTKRILYICPLPMLLIEVQLRQADASPGWFRLLAFWLRYVPVHWLRLKVRRVSSERSAARPCPVDSANGMPCILPAGHRGPHRFPHK